MYDNNFNRPSGNHYHPTSYHHCIKDSSSSSSNYNQPISRFQETNSISHIKSSAQIQDLLKKQLGPEFLSTRTGAGGCKLTYIEGWRVISLANDIFGYDGWSSETRSIEVDFIDESTDGRFNVGVSALVRIWLRDGNSHEDVGYGKVENCKSKGDAMDKCKKEAVTDALKRTLRMFGNLMGNCLYDKSYLNSIKNLRASKEKFLPSKLFRAEHLSKDKVGGAETESIENESLDQTAVEENAPAPKTTTSKTENFQRPLKQPVKLEPILKRVDTFPPQPPKITVPDKRKVMIKENGLGEKVESCSELQPPPPTFSDSYFDLDEKDLAQLDGMDNSECGINTTLGETTVSEEDSCTVTENSIRLNSNGMSGLGYASGFGNRLGVNFKKPPNPQNFRSVNEADQKSNATSSNEPLERIGSGWKNVINLQNRTGGDTVNGLNLGKSNNEAQVAQVGCLPGIRGSRKVLNATNQNFPNSRPTVSIKSKNFNEAQPQIGDLPQQQAANSRFLGYSNNTNGAEKNKEENRLNFLAPPLSQQQQSKVGIRRGLSEIDNDETMDNNYSINNDNHHQNSNYFNCPAGKKVKAEG